MSFGALSEEAKVALAKGAELAGTGICSGEGGMLSDEQEANSRYFYELASAGSAGRSTRPRACRRSTSNWAKERRPARVDIYRERRWWAASPRCEVFRRVNRSISPSTFPDFHGEHDFRRAAEEVRQVRGGIPIGVKMSAQHIEDDIDAALRIGVDYIILDGRGGGTGAAPVLFRDHISVPTIPALAGPAPPRRPGRRDVTLVVTGGLRTHTDFAKALALGADAVAVANSAMQAIGCLGMRACSTNNCPVGIATQKLELRSRLPSTRRPSGCTGSSGPRSS